MSLTPLLRPGRFDRQISVDKPDVIGREAIFKVRSKPLKLATDVNIQKLSSQTPGFAGAEIANVCNEAALIAARRNREEVTMQDFQDAMDRVIGGLEKKNKLISPEEKADRCLPRSWSRGSRLVPGTCRSVGEGIHCTSWGGGIRLRPVPPA